MSLQAFKNITVDRLAIDELVALLVFGKQLRAEYETLLVDPPEYINQNIKSIGREIKARTADDLEARHREIKLKLDASRTPEQKRAALLKEQKKIEEQLAAIG